MKKEKLYLIENEKMGEYEKEQKRASYRTIVERFVGDIVLCNNICDIDCSVYDNETYYETNTPEIYQFYLCHVSDYEKEQAEKAGLIFSYSDKLECDVLCVDHYGTSWDYVLTDCEIVPNYETLKEKESED